MSRVSGLLSLVRRESARIWISDWETRRFRARRLYLPRGLAIVSFPLRLVLAVMLISLLRVIKPVVYLRFARLASSSLGLFTLPTEVYLCEVAEELHPKKAIDIFYHYQSSGFTEHMAKNVKPAATVCNEHLDKMIKRRLRVHDVARPLDNLVRMLPAIGSDFSVVDVLPSRKGREKGNEYLSRQEDLRGLLDQHPAHLRFTELEEVEGAKLLEAMGVAVGSPFVCFHARDGAWFPNAIASTGLASGELPRDDRRNAAIQNYLPAIENLVSLGYHAVRMGKWVAEPLIIDNPRIIDYSTKFQADFMDLYLSAKCDFFIGQNSGMTGLPLVFRTPIAFVNVFPLRYINYCANEPNIFIPKNIYSDEKGRLLTFREQFELGVARLNVNDVGIAKEAIETLGLRILENTPSEITEVASEMHQRLRSEFVESSETRELRGEFLDVIRSYPEAVYFVPSRCEHLKIASCFLERHPELVS